MVNIGGGIFDFVANISGKADARPGEDTGSEMQNAPINTLRNRISGLTTYSIPDYVAFISGGNVTVINGVNQSIVVSGNVVTTTLQSGINAMTGGQTLMIKEGLYQLGSGSLIPAPATAIIGQPSGWGQGTDIRATTNVPAVIFSGGGAKFCELRDLFFTHNISGYSSALVTLTGTAEVVKLNNCIFYDFGNYALSGAAIALDNGGVTTGPTFCIFNQIETEGFNCVYKVTVSGGAAPFINGNQFTNQVWSDVGAFGLSLNSVANSDFDGNIFSNIVVQANFGPDTKSVFDYSTNVAGNVFYNKHIGVAVFDLPAAGVYATVNPSTEIDCMSCLTDQKISGTGHIRHWSFYTDDRGTTNITSSGAGTTSWFIPYLSIASNTTNAPGSVVVTAANSGTSSLGAPFITNINISGFTINAPNAAASGLALSWNWRANL